MSNIAIIEIYPTIDFKNASKKIDAHLRNSLRIKDLLGCDLLLCEKDFNAALRKKYDCFILGYASRYAPFNFINKLLESNPEAKKIVLSNEYNIASSIGGFKPFHLIANYEGKTTKSPSILSYTFVNLNVLIFNAFKQQVEKKYDCIYYGTFRENRAEYFKRYLQKGVFLSTSIKNMKKFKHVGCNPTYINKFSWEKENETLNLFKYSLYIEDVYTHNNYNCLANRFYEAVMCKTVLFFDKNCRNTVRRSGICLEDYFFVSDYEELTQKICESDYANLYKKQQYFLDFAIEEKGQQEMKLKNVVDAIISEQSVL